MGKQGKKDRVGWLYQVIAILPCAPCRKRQKPDVPSVDHAEKGADPSSPAITRTSTTISPPRSPHVPSPPVYTDVSHISTASGRVPTDVTLVPTPSQQQSPSTWGVLASKEPDSPISHQPTTQPSHGQKQRENETSTVDSDLDNLDKIFEEAWKPGNGLSLADGTKLPWSKGRSSPSAAAKYLDEIEDGL